MKKLLFIIIIVFISCSKDTVFEGTDIIPDKPSLYCDCTSKLYQVSVTGQRILQGTTNVRILCSLSGKTYDQKYNGDRLISYKVYDCN